MGTNASEMSDAEWDQLRHYANSQGLTVDEAANRAASAGLRDRVLFSRGKPVCEVVKMSTR